MRQNAGKRLFKAIGQLSEEWILEAALDGLEEEPAVEKGCENADAEEEKTEKGMKKTKEGRSAAFLLFQRAGGYLKYLPVAACLCLVFCGVYYIADNYYRASVKDGYFLSGGSQDMGADSSGSQDGAAADALTETAQDAREKTSEQEKHNLPVRYDAYEGPVLPLTATGDTQNLKTSRQLNCTVTTRGDMESSQPLLDAEDKYQIKNTSREDKTVQLVYPFAATLNLAYEMKGEILKIHGQENAAVTYDIGDSIYGYQYKNQDSTSYNRQEPPASSGMSDYESLLDEESSYQENAFEKEADWNREVSVYTFSEIHMPESSGRTNNTDVVGVTVYGTEADVLTFGFDYASNKADGVTNYCFFASGYEPKLMLIVTGEQEREPALGYYSNLDCEEAVDGIQCTMQKQKMAYSDALQLCAAAAVKQKMQDYGQDIYDGELPEYFDTEIAYQALTMAGRGEEDFYDALLQRWQTAELKEICEKIFGETRLVYAMATVTIPAGKTLKVTARTQKRPVSMYYALAEGQTDALAEGQKEDAHDYDFLSSAKSLLNIKKALLQLSLPKEWKLADSNPSLKQKKSV